MLATTTAIATYPAAEQTELVHSSGTMTGVTEADVGHLELHMMPERSLPQVPDGVADAAAVHGSVWLASLRGTAQPGRLQTVSMQSAASSEHAWILSQSPPASAADAAGPSVPWPAGVSVVGLSESAFPESSLWAGGSLRFEGGRAQWSSRSSSMASAIDVHAGGDITIHLGESYGAAPLIAIVSPRGSLQPGAMVAIAAKSAGPTSIRITTLVETDKSSALGHHDLDVLVLGPPGGPTIIEAHATCAIRLDPGGQPVMAWRQGGLTAPITQESTGVWVVELAPGYGLGREACLALTTCHGQLAAGENRSIAGAWLDPHRLRLTLLAEQPSGGSAPENFPLDLALLRLIGG